MRVNGWSNVNNYVNRLVYIYYIYMIVMCAYFYSTFTNALVEKTDRIGNIKLTETLNCIDIQFNSYKLN